MKRIIIASALALSFAAMPASAHDEREAAAEEVTEGCLKCCAGIRPTVRDGFELNDERCIEACVAYTKALFPDISDVYDIAIRVWGLFRR